MYGQWRGFPFRPMEGFLYKSMKGFLYRFMKGFLNKSMEGFLYRLMKGFLYRLMKGFLYKSNKGFLYRLMKSFLYMANDGVSLVGQWKVSCRCMLINFFPTYRPWNLFPAIFTYNSFACNPYMQSPLQLNTHNLSMCNPSNLNHE